MGMTCIAPRHTERPSPATRAGRPRAAFSWAILTGRQMKVKVLCVANQFAEGRGMDARQASETLEVIRTLMGRTCQYQLVTARASLVAGSLAGAAALAFLALDASDPWHFGAVWGIVFAGSLLATVIGTVTRGRAS